MIGSVFGGALTDRFGRRKLILFGLVFSALSTLSLGLVNEFALLYPLSMGIGLLGEIAGPAHQAMIADILPEDKRNEGFGMMRVIANLAWIIGPTIGMRDMPIVTYPIMDAASAAGTMSRTMARLSTMPVATAACIIRNARNTPTDGASIAPIVATTKMARDPMTMGRLPNLSEIGPMTSCNSAVATR
jgi:MFS family permease